jgi:hypothetical protein
LNPYTALSLHSETWRLQTSAYSATEGRGVFSSVSSLVLDAWMHGVTSVYMISYLILRRFWVNNVA